MDNLLSFKIVNSMQTFISKLRSEVSHSSVKCVHVHPQQMQSKNMKILLKNLTTSLQPTTIIPDIKLYQEVFGKTQRLLSMFLPFICNLE